METSQLRNSLNLIKMELNEAENIVNGIMNGKPVINYTELEYIESTGTQYIDTQVIGDSDKRIIFKIDRNNSYNSAQFFGAWSNENCIMGEIYQSNLDFYIGTISNFKRIGNISNLPTILTFDISNVNFSVYNATNDEIYNTTYNMENWSTLLNIFLFGRNNRGTFQNINGTYKIYYCKIYDNNILVRDMIPVKRLSNGAICMYDKVTGKFFENQGTGEFIAGGEL